nr:MAG TPA: hypothetical protein [Caudoviricetes sp.]
MLSYLCIYYNIFLFCYKEFFDLLLCGSWLVLCSCHISLTSIIIYGICYKVNNYFKIFLFCYYIIYILYIAILKRFNSSIIDLSLRLLKRLYEANLTIKIDSRIKINPNTN